LNKTNYNTIIIGGGAAGFFTAINLAEQTSNHSIAILERGKDVLQKVRISGGGRCNVTHAEFEPKPLSRNYPRGEKELLGPFHSFMTGDTIAWFEERGVESKKMDVCFRFLILHRPLSTALSR
jgi:predicted flavoprotein YhiN